MDAQTTRAAVPSLSPAVGKLGGVGLASWTRQAEAAARAAGIDFLSFGRLPATAHDVVAEHLAPILAAGEVGFLSADLVDGRLPSVAMAGACAKAVKQLAGSTPQGFGNLRFAATANCPPNIPFLPAAFHVGGSPQFAIPVHPAHALVDSPP